MNTPPPPRAGTPPGTSLLFYRPSGVDTAPPPLKRCTRSQTGVAQFQRRPGTEHVPLFRARLQLRVVDAVPKTMGNGMNKVGARAKPGAHLKDILCIAFTHNERIFHAHVHREQAHPL